MISSWSFRKGQPVRPLDDRHHQTRLRVQGHLRRERVVDRSDDSLEAHELFLRFSWRSSTGGREAKV